MCSIFLTLQYLQECFISNKIDGKKLILVNASALPKIGITDLEHIKVRHEPIFNIKLNITNFI